MIYWLLADRTNGRGYGTMLCPSVCRLSVCNACAVAKRYVLPKNCLKKQIGLPDRYPVVRKPCRYLQRFGRILQRKLSPA